MTTSFCEQPVSYGKTRQRESEYDRHSTFTESSIFSSQSVSGVVNWEVVLPPRGHVAMFGAIFDYYNSGMLMAANRQRSGMLLHIL